MADEYWGDLPVGFGFRVPMIVVSPWTVGGFACSEVFDHSSMTQFLERWTGVATDQMSDWRRTVSGDLTSTFDFKGAGGPPSLAQPGEVPPFTGRWRPAPPADQALPAQEPGVRPARPLPYQTDAWAHVDGDRLKVSLANNGDRSAHFAVYGFAGETAEPVHFDVHGCTDTELALAGDAYDVTVSGPNRFVREFAGTQSGAAVSLLVTSDVPRRAGRLTLTLVNCSDATLDVTVAPLAYSDDEPRQLRLRPGRERRVTSSTADTEGWYDLEITAAQDTSFRRRLTGHLENGRPSVTG